MKLYEMPRNVGIRLYGFKVDNKPAVIIFGHIDGMYSYCWLEESPQEIVHINASTEFKKYKDGYKLVEEK